MPCVVVSEGNEMAGLAILGELLRRPAAVLILRFSNIYPQLVTYDELHESLQLKFAAKGRELPSDATVKAELDFLVREKLLEVEGVKYRITLAGVEAASELTPHTATTS